ncbi:unnamed protein product [Urochloa humidicola]
MPVRGGRTCLSWVEAACGRRASWTDRIRGFPASTSLSSSAEATPRRPTGPPRPAAPCRWWSSAGPPPLHGRRRHVLSVPPGCHASSCWSSCAVPWMYIGCDLVVLGLSFIHPVLSEESNISCMFCRKRLPFWHQAVVEEMLGGRGAQSTWL